MSIERYSPFLFVYKKETNSTKNIKNFTLAQKILFSIAIPASLTKAPSTAFIVFTVWKLARNKQEEQNFYKKIKFQIELARNMLKQWTRQRRRCSEVDQDRCPQAETSNYQHKFVCPDEHNSGGVTMSIFHRGRPSRQIPPNRPGMYRFKSKLTGEVEYIGEAVNIARRIVEHLRSSKPVSLDTHYVEWKAADRRSTSRTRREHERVKISKHKPRLNGRGGGGGRRARR